MKTIRFLLPGLLLCITLAKAQQPVQKIQNAAPFKLFFERAYLHTDRDIYSTGEDIWFKAYFVNAQTNNFTATSNNLYVELISPELKIVSRELVRIENGTGSGDFKLKDSLPGGTYLLRAYTNWMRNFGDDFIFEKKISINSIAGIKPVVSPAAKPAIAQNSQRPGQSVQISFFPEGGSMIAGINSIVAFKTEDVNGKPVKAKGAIISSKGDTAAWFVSTEKGMGAFLFSPKPATTYRAEGVDGSGKRFDADLPPALTKGFAIHVAGTDSAYIKVLISADPQQLAESKGKMITIAANHSAHTVYSTETALANAVTTIKIPIKDVPAGITAITLYDDQKKPHCERLVYVPLKDKIKLTVSANKAAYKPKEPVTLTLKATDMQGRPVQTKLSLSVVDNSIVPESHSNIESYLLLESELRGEIEDPDQYFNEGNASRAKDLDMLLMTQGWRDFVWRHLSDTAINLSFMPEPGLTISGNIKNNGKPVAANTQVTLFVNGADGNKIFLTKTNAEGKFFFDGVKFYSGQNARISAKDLKGKPAGKITLDPAGAKAMETGAYGMLNIEQAVAEKFRTESQRRIAEQKKQSLADTIILKEVQVKNNRTSVSRDGQVRMKSGYPDQVFNITDKDHDYKSLRHYLLTNVDGAVPDDSNDRNGVMFISQGKKVRPRFVVNYKEDLYQRMDYYELSMEDIEQVRVSRYISINMGDIYMISLTLKPEALAPKGPGQLVASLNGYYAARTFYSPKYISQQAVVRTDVRTTIFWQPNIATNSAGMATVTFFNADPKARIGVSVQGIALKGVPVTAKTTYLVN